MEKRNKPTKETATKMRKESQVNTQRTNSAQEPVAVGRSWNIGAIFWGLLLVVSGGLLLLGNLGIVEISWSELWRLWPLLIVAAGFSVLATAHWLWKVVSIVFIVGALLAVLWVGTGQYNSGTDTQSPLSQRASVDVDNGVTKADVTIRAGASKLTIRSDDMSRVVQARLESDSMRLAEDSSRRGTTQNIVLSGRTQNSVWFGPQQNIWDVTVTERLPMKLAIDSGASSVDADLSETQLTDLLIQAGASSSVVTLGQKQSNIHVDVSSGASSMTLRIPKDSGVAMNFKGGLSSRELDDLEEVSEGKYRSDNYETAANRISINADAGLASFKIERY